MLGAALLYNGSEVESRVTHVTRDFYRTSDFRAPRPFSLNAVAHWRSLLRLFRFRELALRVACEWFEDCPNAKAGSRTDSCYVLDQSSMAGPYLTVGGSGPGRRQPIRAAQSSLCCAGIRRQ
jgi:hypothetical protein